MIILNCNNISLSFGIDKLLDNVSFNIQDSEKAGIVGVNGAGKSTLLKIVLGSIKPDGGEIYIAKGYKIGFLEQNSGLDSSNNVWEELISIYSGLIAMEARLKELEQKISTEKDESRLHTLMKEYDLLTLKYSNSGGYEYNSRVRGVLRGLGFYEHQFNTMIRTLSGGQKTRLALAKLLLEEPDILLLDEPTNHLDISALEWLEDFLRSYKKCILLVSHDRYFLDSVTNKTIEIENCECKVYSGNYSAYLKQKSLDREIQQKHFDLQQKEISRMEAFIEQQRRWNREKNIIAAESRQKAIDRLEKIDKPKVLPDKIKVKFRSSIISGNDVLFVEHLSKEYPGKPLFKDVNFNIKKKEKIFLTGPNGCGKSTLLKILAGKLSESSGSFEYGHNVKIGYYDQEQQDLNDSNTVLDEVWNSNEKLAQTQIRNSLASFLFKSEDVLKSVSILSGGEKSRVSLVKLMLSGDNFLLLDEPTNHLDINSREVLEESLLNFDGTILAVSHDRYFINKLSTRILEFDNDSIIDFYGNYADYLTYSSKRKKNIQSNTVDGKVSISKLERIADKEEKAKERKIERQLNEAEKEIHQIEDKLIKIGTEMGLQEVVTDHVKLTELVNEQNKLRDRLEELYGIWEALATEKEGML